MHICRLHKYHSKLYHYGKKILSMDKKKDCFFKKSYALKTAVLICLYLIPREKEKAMINIESSIICKPPVQCRSIIQSL